MPYLRLEDTNRFGPELHRSAAEPLRDPAAAFERIRSRACERGNSPEELALALVLELALTRAGSADDR